MLSNGEASDWLQMYFDKGQWPQTYGVKDKVSWKWWHGPHRALISTPSSVCGITRRDRRIWHSLHPQKIWKFGTTFKNCVQVYPVTLMLFRFHFGPFTLPCVNKLKNKLLTLTLFQKSYFTAFFHTCLKLLHGTVLKITSDWSRCSTWIEHRRDCYMALTWTSGVGLILIAPAVICSITKPSLGNTAIVAAFELIGRAAVIVYEKFKQEKKKKRRPITLQRLNGTNKRACNTGYKEKNCSMVNTE